MYGERPIDRRRAATRQEILDAAWAQCREHGLAGLSLRELAERVGLRAPSLYSCFPSKDAIYDAMFADANVGCSRCSNCSGQPRRPARRCTPAPGRTSSSA